MVIRIIVPPRIGAAIKGLETFPARVLQGIAKALDLENELTVGHIVATRMTGTGPFPAEEGKLGVRTGRLRRSLRPSQARVVGSYVLSSIGTNVEYAGIHEFGGTIPAHDIRPKKGKALRFMVGGAVIFASRVHMPAVTMPRRAPISRGIEERVENYRHAVGAAVLSTWDQT